MFAKKIWKIKYMEKKIHYGGSCASCNKKFTKSDSDAIVTFKIFCHEYSCLADLCGEEKCCKECDKCFEVFCKKHIAKQKHKCI